MLAQKKKVMAMGRPSRLPSGYRELAFIEATGEQYIDLNMTNLTRFVVGFAAAPNLVPGAGAVVARSIYVTQFLAHYDNGHIAAFSSAAEVPRFSFDATERHAYDGVITNNSITVEAAGETISHTSTYTYSSGHPLLFAMWSISQSDARYFGAGKMFSAKLWQTGTVGNPYRDLVPAERVSDGAAGMYDQINNVFLGNAGTGVFGKGPYV